MTPDECGDVFDEELVCDACVEILPTPEQPPTLDRPRFDRQYIETIASEITRHGGKESQPYFAKRIAEAGRSVLGSLAAGAQADDELRGWLRTIVGAMSLS